MYDENMNREFSENENGNSEAHVPNFVMRDSNEVQRGTEREGTGNQSQPGQEYQNVGGASGQSVQSQNCQNTENAFGQAGGSPSYQNMGGMSSQANQSQGYQNAGSASGRSSGNQSYNWQPAQNDGYRQESRQPEIQAAGNRGGDFGNRSGSPEKKEKKKSGRFGRKVAGITAAALLFGTVSGGTMVGINMAARSFEKETYPQVSSQAAVTDETTEAARAAANDNSVQASTALALDVSAIVKEAMPSVVAINNTMLYQSNSWWGGNQTYEVPSSGSGIIVGQNDTELLIATNNHVVENSENLSVVFIDDTSVNATVRGTDADSDLAVIAVALQDIPEDTISQISVAKLGNSDELEVGQGVIAIGNALGYGQSVTVGYVSALDREVTTDGTTTRNLLQTDAAINPGNSGGALLNMKGEVIGINAAKYSSTDVEGIGYAIPISKAQDILNTLMTKRTDVVEEGEEGYLGIQGLTVDDSMVKQLDMPAGVFVYGIIEGGAAAQSDLREKDVITKFDGQSVKTMAALQDLLKCYKAGETVDVTVQSLENGQYVERVVSITLGEKATLGQDNQSGNQSQSQSRNGQAQGSGQN